MTFESARLDITREYDELVCSITQENPLHPAPDFLALRRMLARERRRLIKIVKKEDWECHE